MAEEFEGPVVIHGELQIPGPVRPEPAAQFGSHVGVDGNLELAGNLNIRAGDLNIQETGSLHVKGPVRPQPAAQFGSHVGVDGNLELGGNLNIPAGDLNVGGRGTVGGDLKVGGRTVGGNLDVRGKLSVVDRAPGETSIEVNSNGTGIEVNSNGGAALRAIAKNSPSAIFAGASAGVVLRVEQDGSEEIIIGRGVDNTDVFRVLATGEVHVLQVVQTCDENVKTDFSNVTPNDILDKLSRLTLQEWSYKTDPSNVRHIGPTSQDFQATFNLNGEDDVHISAIDAQGVAFAAIQGLNEKLTSENSQLRARLAVLEARIEVLAADHDRAKTSAPRPPGSRKPR
jgi:hypothetical protein